MRILPVVEVAEFTGSTERHEYKILEGDMVIQSPYGVSVEDRARARALATPSDHWAARRGTVRFTGGTYTEHYKIYLRP